MNNEEFVFFRKKLGKTQKQMAELLGTSLKAVHSYEQGWRNIPPSVERQVLFLFSRKQGIYKSSSPCWRINKCPPEQQKRCPAYEFDAGNWCWFICGTICEGSAHPNWSEKMKVCRNCKVFAPLLPESNRD